MDELANGADQHIQEVLTLLGISDLEVQEGDVNIEIADLENRMGMAWASLARISAMEEEARHSCAVLRGQIEQENAMAYEQIAASMPKATETAKKNAILTQHGDIARAEERILELDHRTALLKGIRHALEIRVDMLQSINKLKVCEMDRIHAHLRTDPS
jgi:multidrug resistance efflux pump